MSEPVAEVAQVTTPQPTTPQAAPKQARTGDCSLVNNYNWDKRIAYAVCMAESGGNTMAANMNDNHGQCRGSFGLMQLACFWTADPHDPVENMNKAYEIYSRSSWQPWGAYTSGAYLRHM